MERPTNKEHFFAEARTSSFESLVASLKEMDLHLQLIPISLETGQDMKILVASDSSLALPKSVLSKLAQYVQKSVLREKGTDLGRKDCASVAGQAQRTLEQFFQKNNLAFGTIGTNATGTPLKFFPRFGYDHHIINYAEGSNIAAAIDLTAGYTVDTEHGNYSILVIACRSVQDLEDTLKKITGTSWSVRD